jgi:hypothetical protein
VDRLGAALYDARWGSVGTGGIRNKEPAHMVHGEVKPLLAWGLASLNWAKSLFVLRLVAHGAALACVLLGALNFSNRGEQALHVEIICVVAGLLFELLAILLHQWGMHNHSLGRQLMRRAMLTDALSPADADVVRQHFGEHIGRSLLGRFNGWFVRRDRERLLRHHEGYLAGYYYSPVTPPQEKRLRDHLMESAIFSRRLYWSAAIYSVVLFVLILVAALVALSWITHPAGLGVIQSEHAALDILYAIIIFLPLSQELEHSLLYLHMALELGGFCNALEKLYSPKVSANELGLRLRADFGDYGAFTTFAPPIRNWVYKLLAKKLADQMKDEVFPRLYKAAGESWPAEESA